MNNSSLPSPSDEFGKVYLKYPQLVLILLGLVGHLLSIAAFLERTSRKAALFNILAAQSISLLLVFISNLFNWISEYTSNRLIHRPFACHLHAFVATSAYFSALCLSFYACIERFSYVVYSKTFGVGRVRIATVFTIIVSLVVHLNVSTTYGIFHSKERADYFCYQMLSKTQSLMFNIAGLLFEFLITDCGRVFLLVRIIQNSDESEYSRMIYSSNIFQLVFSAPRHLLRITELKHERFKYSYLEVIHTSFLLSVSCHFVFYLAISKDFRKSLKLFRGPTEGDVVLNIDSPDEDQNTSF